MGNSSNRDAKAAATAVTRRKALEMRLAHASYEQIAAAGLGTGFENRSNVRKHVQAAIAAITEEPAEEVRKLEITRLDALALGLWKKAKAGDVQAVDRLLRIQERRASYLGLDAPKLLKVELERELSGHLEKLKAGLTPDVFEQVLSVLAGEHGAATAGADPDGSAEEDNRGPDEPG
jgi:hypothetical protein